MAEQYDRFDDGRGGGSFVMGLLTGTVLGAGLGMLFAPKAGSELRNQLSEQAGSIANNASEAAAEWADRGRQMYGKAWDAVAKGADEAKSYARDAVAKGADEARDAVNKGADEAQKYVREASKTVTASMPTMDSSRTIRSSEPNGPRRS